jgi:hypothetical protein
VQVTAAAAGAVATRHGWLMSTLIIMIIIIAIIIAIVIITSSQFMPLSQMLLMLQLPAAELHAVVTPSSAPPHRICRRLRQRLHLNGTSA